MKPCMETLYSLRPAIALMLVPLSLEAQGAGAKSNPGTGSWRVEATRSEMTDKRGVTLTLRANSTIPGIFGPATPILIVRCREGQLNVYVNSQRVLDSDTDDETSVRLRFDDGEPISEDWSISTDHSSAFAADPGGFVLGPILESRVFRIELRPFDAAPVVAVFRPAGLGALLPRLRAACPIPLTPVTPTAAGPSLIAGSNLSDSERRDSTLSTQGIDFPFPEYLNNVVRQIALNFKPSDTNSALRAEVMFLIYRDGAVKIVRFVTRSGSYAFDLQAQGAIESAGPNFGPLPAAFRDGVLPVVFNFDPHVLR